MGSTRHEKRLGSIVGLAVVVLVACEGGDSSDDGIVGDDAGDGPNCEAVSEAEFPTADTAACLPAATDYQPGGDDPFPSCATDDGEYHLVEGTPSSVARVEAFAAIVERLSGSPSAEDFTAARTEYAMDEGLESRVLRREDLHYPAIPASDFDPDFEDDKQCSAPSNVVGHPDRCVGPATIAPLVDEAFVAGMTEEGSPEINAARIEAGLLWFLWLSTFKEASTCIDTPKDCDSSWAYYGGGFDRAGGIGLAAEVRAASDLAHSRVFDGVSAVRCWRELYPIEDYATRGDLPAEGEQLLAGALAQLDDALWFAMSVVVRERIMLQDATCGVQAEANWAAVQILGPVLELEANKRDAAQASELSSLWATDDPTVEQLEDGVAALDAVFPCP